VTAGENEMLRQGAALLGSTAHSAISVAIASFWSEGPGGPHYQNLIGAWSAVGCGVVRDGSLWTVVQDFR
jgi:hypothetical protein